MKVLVLGRGVGCRLHVPAWRAAGAEVSSAVREGDISSVGVVAAYGLDPCAWDVVVAALPPELHRVVAVDLADAGVRRLVVEKPCGEHTADAAEIGRLTGRLEIGVNFGLAAHPLSRELAAQFASTPGMRAHIELCVQRSGTGDVPRWSSQGWSPWGVLLPHVIALARRLGASRLSEATLVGDELRGVLVAERECSEVSFALAFSRPTDVVRIEWVDGVGRQGMVDLLDGATARSADARSPWRVALDASVAAVTGGASLGRAFEDVATAVAVHETVVAVRRQTAA